jgi:hypothetical protein
MDEDKIEEYVDRTGFAQDTEFVLKELNKVYEAFKKLDGYRFRLGTPVGMTETVQVTKEAVKEFEKATEANKKLAESEKVAAQAAKIASSSYSELAAVAAANEIAMKRLAASKKEVEKAFKDGKISEEQYLLSLAKIKEQQTAFSVSQQQVNLSLKNLEKEAQAAEGSLNEMRAQLSLAQMAWDKLSETDRQSEIGAQLLNNVNTLNKAVSELEQSSGRFQRNVGNYQGSARIIVDALKDVEKEIETLKNRQNELQNLSKSNPIGFKLQGGSDELGQINARLAETTKQFEVLDRITTQPRFLNIAAKSGDLQKELSEFRKRLIELEDAGLRNTKVYTDVQKRLAQLTDQIADTKDEIKALSSDTRQFDLFAGGVKLLASAWQIGAGAATAFGANAQTVERSLQKLVAIQNVAQGVQSIANELTTKGTVANKLYNTVLEQGSILFGKGATAAARFGVALKSIALLGVAAMLLDMADSMGLFGTQTAAAKKEVDDLNESLQRQIDLLNEQLKIIDTAGDLQLAKLRQQTDDRNRIFESEQDNRRDQLRAILEEQDKISKAIGETQAGLSRLGPDTKWYDTFAKQEKARLFQLLGLYNKQFEELRKQAIDKTNEIALAEENEKAALAEEARKKEQERADKRLRDARQYAEKERRARLDLLLLQLEAEAELSAAQADISTQDGPRERALDREFELRKMMIEATRDFELNSEGVTETQRKVIIAQAERDIYALRLEFIEKTTAARIKARQEEEDLIIAQAQEIANEELKAVEQALKKLNKENDSRASVLSIDKDTELKNLNLLFAAGAISKEEYEERKQRIEAEYLRNSLLAQIAYYREVVKISGLSNDEKEKALRELAKLERELSEFTIRTNKEAAEETKSEWEQTVDYLINARSQIIDLAAGLFTAGFEREKNAIQDQIDLLDEKSQKEIELVNQTIANEERREAAISIIEARAAARRRVLEAEQRRVDQQRARFERVAQIAKIIGDTASAVTEALPNIPLSIAVGAIGGLQLLRVLSTEIPRYKFGKGPGDKYEGFAIWGDGGKRELKLSTDGSTEVSGTTPTVTHVKRDDLIFPDADLYMRLANANAERVRRRAQEYFDKRDNGSVDLKPVVSVMSRGLNTLNRTIKNKREIHFNGLTPAQRAVKYRRGHREYFDMNGID